MSLPRFTIGLGFILLAACTSSTSPALDRCSTADQLSEMMKSNTTDQLPNFQKAPGYRVQLQHPDTSLTAHTKYHEANGTTGFSCNYYNYVGLVGIYFIVDRKKSNMETDAYWRKDFLNSNAEQDDFSGGDFIEVCMENRGSTAYPSVKCAFAEQDS